MQRIDRELNASLDVERILRITLEWAMRQTHADAGLVGLLQNGDPAQPASLRVTAAQGYPAYSSLTPQTTLPLEPTSLAGAVQTGQPVLVDLPVEGGSAGRTILPAARRQAAVPIRRQSQVIGALLLEGFRADALTGESVAFVWRLSDHAAIAISNAQLYAEVQAANIAKSEFVSLVSHELKTPMTSIRGYTDLLAQGAVGPVNEVQANFLGTIRSNVNRMATLVSDLADISRIEAGRMRLEFSAVTVADTVEEVVRSARPRSTKRTRRCISKYPLICPRFGATPTA